MLQDLAWMGLEFDEGPGKPGPCGPYAQSLRLGGYERAFERLKAAGHLYPCTCTRSEIAGAASAPHSEDAAPYPGTCRLGPSHPGRPEAWRFRMPVAQPFMDVLAGAQPGLSDDFVVRRGDGVYAYQFASAVDDAAMGITEVLRAADLLPSASRQTGLLLALGAPVPAWLHVPLLLGPDGARLGKRHGSISVSEYRRAGYSPGGFLGLLAATLGLARPGEDLGLGVLLERFSVAGLKQVPARFEGPWPPASASMGRE
jgi:glutamyl-tRNA synthetase